MKTAKLLKRLKTLLDPETRKEKIRRGKLRALLKQLKKRSSKLQAKLEQTKDNEKRRKIERELDVVCEQRRKGVHLCREIGRK